MRLKVMLVGSGQEREIALEEGSLEKIVDRFDLDPALLEATVPEGPDDDDEKTRFQRMLATIIAEVFAGDFVRTVGGRYLATGAIAEVWLSPDEIPF